VKKRNMSRHRDVRNLDTDALLDDEAGGDAMSPEEAEKLDQAVDAITERIGDGFSIKEVRDTAWYYYFDVDQSTNYLLGRRDINKGQMLMAEQNVKRQAKATKAKAQTKAASNSGMSLLHLFACSSS
jgi:elongation factor 1 alpha-like protein